MKNQLPIKFRGKNKNGEFVFMELAKPVSFNGEEVEELTQLIGYDKNGREVYEGDALQMENGVTIYAYVLRHAKIAPTKDLDFTEMAKEDGWTVKESAEKWQ